MPLAHPVRRCTLLLHAMHSAAACHTGWRPRHPFNPASTPCLAFPCSIHTRPCLPLQHPHPALPSLAASTPCLAFPCSIHTLPCLPLQHPPPGGRPGQRRPCGGLAATLPPRGGQVGVPRRHHHACGLPGHGVGRPGGCQVMRGTCDTTTYMQTRRRGVGSPSGCGRRRRVCQGARPLSPYHLVGITHLRNEWW